MLAHGILMSSSPRRMHWAVPFPGPVWHPAWAHHYKICVWKALHQARCLEEVGQSVGAVSAYVMNMLLSCWKMDFRSLSWSHICSLDCSFFLHY